MPSAPKLEAPQGQPLFDVQFRAISESLAGNGVLDNSDLKVTDGTNALEIDVAAGTAYYIATEYTYAGGSPAATLTAGDANDDRWDTIAFDTATTSVVVHEGTPEQYPSPPDIAGGELLLAIVYVPAGATDIGSSNILNWRAKFSNEAEEVHYDDPDGFWGQDNVQGALNQADNLLVRRDYPEDSGALGNLVDFPVSATPAAGTEQSYDLAVDGTAIARMYAEADGAGGIQNPRFQVPVERAQIGEESSTDTPELDEVWETNATNTNVTAGDVLHFRQATSGNGVGYYELRNRTTDTKLNGIDFLPDGTAQFFGDIATDTGTVIFDASAGALKLGVIPSGVDLDWVRGNDNTITGVLADLGTNPGAFSRLIDATVDGTPSAGTEQSYTLGIDGGSILRMYAEADGAGGVQNQRVDSVVPLRLLAASGAGGTFPGDTFYDTDENTPKFHDGSSYERPLARLDDRQFDKDETGTVNAGNVGLVWFTNVPNGATIEVVEAGLLLDDLQAAPTGVDLVIYTGDNAGAATKRATVITGDGATAHDRVTGSPVASWTNSTGGDLTTAIGVDNGNFNTGSGAAQDIGTHYIGRVVV